MKIPSLIINVIISHDIWTIIKLKSSENVLDIAGEIDNNVAIVKLAIVNVAISLAIKRVKFSTRAHKKLSRMVKFHESGAVLHNYVVL